MRNNNNKNPNADKQGERPYSSIVNNNQNNAANQLGSSLEPNTQIVEVPASENDQNRVAASQAQSRGQSGQSAQGNVPAYESSSSKKVVDPAASDQIKEFNDGVPRMIQSRDGFAARKAEPQANENESLAGVSIDAPTMAFPRDQQSMYQSQKDYRSEMGLKKEDERGDSGLKNGNGKPIVQVKGKTSKEPLLVFKGLPEPEAEAERSNRQRNSAVIGQNDQIMPDEEEKPRSKLVKYCGCCWRSDDPEEVEIHLDNCGKHSIVFAFLIMQLASIATFCILYLQFFNRECIFPVYKLTQPTVLGIEIEMEQLFKFNAVISICLKFASVVCLRIALDEYQELNANCSCFVFSILFSLAPNALMAPMYTYDHNNCMAKNFFVTQGMAELLCAWSVFFLAVPIALLILIPNFLKKFWCCKKRKQAVVSENNEEFKQQVLQKQLDNKKSCVNRLSTCLMYLINLVVFALIVEMFFVTLLIHLPTYRLFEGEFFASGGCNELLSFVILLLLVFMFRSREITEKQIKKMIEKYIALKFRNQMQLRAGLVPARKKEQQEALISARDTEDKNRDQGGTTRAKRTPKENGQDSLQSESHMSVQSKYSGKFANGGPKIGFSAFNPVNPKEKKK